MTTWSELLGYKHICLSHTFLYIYACVHLCMCVYVCVYMCVCVYVCMCVYVCVYVFVCVCVLYDRPMIHPTSQQPASCSEQALVWYISVHIRSPLTSRYNFMTKAFPFLHLHKKIHPAKDSTQTHSSPYAKNQIVIGKLFRSNSSVLTRHGNELTICLTATSLMTWDIISKSSLCSGAVSIYLPKMWKSLMTAS